MAVRIHRPESQYHREGEAWLVEIRLREVRQMFNTLDPSPFHEKDIDDEAEYYITEAVREIGLERPAKLVVHLPADEVRSAAAAALPEAVHHYFAYRAGRAARDLRHTLRDGAVACAIGLLFLAFCLTLRALLVGPGRLNELLHEGLLIIGWVAMWRPLEIFLYDWWPIRRRQRVCERLATISIEVRERQGSPVRPVTTANAAAPTQAGSGAGSPAQR